MDQGAFAFEEINFLGLMTRAVDVSRGEDVCPWFSHCGFVTLWEIFIRRVKNSRCPFSKLFSKVLPEL